MDYLGGKACLDHKNQLNEENILVKIPFSSDRKRASIVVHNPSAKGTNHEVRVYTKGGPDMLLNYATHVINKEGSVVKLDDKTQVPYELN